MATKFTRHRNEVPLLAAFLAIAVIELFVVHLLVSLWHPTAAWIFSAFTVAFLAHVLLLIDGLVRWLTEIDECRLIIR